MKRILITGGSGGIGKTVIDVLLEAKYHVINLDLMSYPIHHSNYQEYLIDIGQKDKLQALLDSLQPVDGIINNAVLSNNADFNTQHINDVQTALEVNILAPILLSQWFAKTYQGTSGRILNISSTRASMSEPNTVAYSVSKGAIEALTHSLAITLQNKHITVNAIAPGWIHHSNEHLRKVDHQFHPSNRVGQPKDIANAILFFLSEENQFINGEVLTIDGGVTKKMIYPE